MQVCCISLCLGDLHNAHIALSLTFWAFGAPFPVFLLRTSPARKRGPVSADYGGSRTEIQRQYIAVKCFLSPEKWPWCHFSGYKTYMGPPTRKARSAPTHRKKFHSIKGKQEWDINYKIGKKQESNSLKIKVIIRSPNRPYCEDAGSCRCDSTSSVHQSMGPSFP